MSDDNLMDHYSDALDEIYRLRALCAYQAQVIEADLGYKTYPKSRRAIAEKRIEILQAAARGDALAQHSVARPELALKSAGASGTLTRWQWEEGRK